jgi:hypothetical protein
VYNLHIMQKVWKEYAPILPVEVQTRTPLKNVQCDNIFGPPLVCFHLWLHHQVQNQIYDNVMNIGRKLFA